MDATGIMIGIVSYGIYFPSVWETADEIALRAGLSVDELAGLGIRGKYRPAADDQPVTMAVRAAGQALERADGVEPLDVDLIIWTGEEYKDYIAQTASIRIQEEVGCRKAWAFDLTGSGVTLIQGLRLAHDLIIGDETINTVLLAGGTRNLDLVDYANPDTRFLLAASASGGAVILQRGRPDNVLLNTAFGVDSEMADEVYVPGGGTEIPFSPAVLGSPLMYFQTPRPEVTARYLEQNLAPALVRVIEKALSGRRPDYLALPHLAPAHQALVLDGLGLAPEQSASLADWGGHGPMDPLISLDLGLKAGKIKNGDLVVLAAAGLGFTYAAAAVRWGRT